MANPVPLDPYTVVELRVTTSGFIQWRKAGTLNTWNDLVDTRDFVSLYTNFRASINSNADSIAQVTLRISDTEKVVTQVKQEVEDTTFKDQTNQALQELGAKYDSVNQAYQLQVQVLSDLGVSLQEKTLALSGSISDIREQLAKLPTPLSADQIMVMIADQVQKAIAANAKIVDVANPSSIPLSGGNFTYTASKAGEVWVSTVIVLISWGEVTLNGKSVWSTAGLSLALGSTQTFQLTNVKPGDVVTGKGLSSATFYPYK